MAKPISSNLRVVTRYNQTATSNAADQKTTMSFDDLAKMQVAKNIVETIAFPLTCMHVRGTVVFAAQLANGDRVGITPVMPRDPADPTKVMAPTNGEEGYLTLERSENCRLTKDGTGKIEFSIRPKFISWETTDEREARLAAEAAEAAKAGAAKTGAAK